jgi:DNA-binding response OmpR family regulator
MVEMSAPANMTHGTTAPKLRILLAEEQAAARDLVVLVLSRLHYQVERAATGRDALARAQRQCADLVLLSATLPDLAGPDLIRALRDVPPCNHTPLVAICPGGSAEIRQACLAAGAAAYLTRPLEIERLLRLIEQLIRRRDQAPAGDPVLDLDHLRGFTDGDPQLEGELSTLFLSTAEMYLRGMHEALASGRPWSSIAHALKGASANLGARRLSALALDAERSEPSRSQLEAIERALEEVRAFFHHHVPG